MYKLIVIGGPLRGQEWFLQKGDNILGSDAGAGISIRQPGVSKRHLKINYTDKGLFLEDLGSSNGTFVNGKLVKQITLNAKDQISLPNVILQVVAVLEKKIIIKKQTIKATQHTPSETGEEIPDPPNTPGGKLIHTFRYRLMRIVYTFNQEYEWHSMLIFALSNFVLITVALTIFPVLSDNKSVLLTEVTYRGFHYADVIAQYNTNYLAQKDFDAVDTKFLDNEPGVESYELLDLDGRIIRPINRLNDFTNDTFSVDALKASREDSKTIKFNKILGSGQFGIAKVIRSYNVKRAQEEPVAVIAIRFAPHSLVLEAANNSRAYLESFSTSGLVAIIFFGVIYFLTLKNFEDLNFQMENVLRGRQKEITSKYLFKELEPLKSAINTILQKYLELQGERSSGEFSDAEDDSSYVETLKQLAQTTKGAVIVLNSSKSIAFINLAAEDITGIRESASLNLPIFDVARDQGFSATVIDLCDQSAASDGRCQRGGYELSGTEYELSVASLIGKDHFAKAYYISLNKE